MSTHPDLSAVNSFLSSYSNKPAAGHMKAALYALHYIYSTYDCGISIMSEAVVPMHSDIYHPSPTDVEAYEDAIPPMPSTSPMLLAYSNACWDLKSEMHWQRALSCLFSNSEVLTVALFPAMAV